MHTPPALYFLHWKFLTPFISLQRTGQTQISPFITTLMLSLFLSNAQNGLSTIPEFLCSASFLFLSNAQDGLSTIPEFLCSASFLFLSNVQDGLSTIPEFLCSASFLFLSNAQDGLPEGRLHGRDPVRRSKPLVILSA